MNEIEAVLKYVKNRARDDRKMLQEQARQRQFGTKRMNPAQTMAYVDYLASQYPVRPWVGPEGPVMGSALFMTLKDDPRVVNGPQVWREIEQAAARAWQRSAA